MTNYQALYILCLRTKFDCSYRKIAELFTIRYKLHITTNQNYGECLVKIASIIYSELKNNS